MYYCQVELVQYYTSADFVVSLPCVIILCLENETFCDISKILKDLTTIRLVLFPVMSGVDEQEENVSSV